MSLRLYYIIIISLVFSPGYGATITTGKDEQALLPYWQLQSGVMRLRLVQRLPDQTRAYFSGRGFNKADVELIASYCFFQSVYKNTNKAHSSEIIEYNLTDWKLVYQEKNLSLMVREKWQDIWQSRNIKQAQKIAMEWSLLPTRQTLKSADYNWGMTAYPVPHGATFDLDIIWKINGKVRKARIPDMKCANDIYVPPVEE